MRHPFYGAGLVVTFGLVLSATAAPDDNKDDSKAAPKADEKKQDAKKPAAKTPKKKDTSDKAASKDGSTDINAKDLRRAVQFVGRLTRVETQQKALTVDITLTYVEPYVSGGRVVYGPKHVSKEVEIQTADNLKVRVANPPPDYDEKGRLKKYTTKELKALRGTEGLPGYEADLDSLKPFQVVQVYLAKKKAPRKSKSKDKDLAEDLQADKKPTAILVYILKDPPVEK